MLLRNVGRPMHVPAYTLSIPILHDLYKSSSSTNSNMQGKVKLSL
jgi:hypothetical protein